jgi:hypothetical protein
MLTIPVIYKLLFLIFRFHQVPDKRFSHDHYATETTIADVLQDYHGGRTGSNSTRNKPSLRSLVENHALQVPNDAAKNWHGEYGFPYEDASDSAFLEKVANAVRAYKVSIQNNALQQGVQPNVDVLQYHFTPHTLAFIVDTLHSLNLTDLRVHRLYDTLADTDEFNIVLKKCSPV